MEGFSGDQLLIVTLIITSFFIGIELIFYLFDVIILKLKRRKYKRLKEVIHMNEEKSELELMLDRMQADLEAKQEKEIEAFEQEQEEKSIISYSELKKAAEKNKQEIAKKVNKQEDEELLNKVNEVSASKQEVTKMEEEIDKSFIPSNEPKSNFTKTEFISPVYGKQIGEVSYPSIPTFDENNEVIFDIPAEEEKNDIHQIKEELFTEDYKNPTIDDKIFTKEYKEPVITKEDIINSNISLEETLNIKPLSQEIKKNVEFLEALKDLRSKL